MQEVKRNFKLNKPKAVEKLISEKQQLKQKKQTIMSTLKAENET